ncbi:conserved hypothetical protein, partial [Ricinus communis]
MVEEEHSISNLWDESALSPSVSQELLGGDYYLHFGNDFEHFFDGVNDVEDFYMAESSE